MTQLLKPCTNCGDLTPTPWCATCKPPKAEPYPKRPRQLGYDSTWDKLSVRARRIQPWCSDCGATDDLTCDHSEQAWQRKADGLPIRLEDVDVVCRSCNAKRGRARPTPIPNATTQGGSPNPKPNGPSPLAQVPLSEGSSMASKGPGAGRNGSRARVRAVRALRPGVGS